MDERRSLSRAGCSRARSEGAGEGGFTLLEVLVSLAVMVVVLVGLVSLLQLNSRVAKAQINVADMQQSLRVVQSDMVRMARMAGRGGLPVFRDPCPAGDPHPICLPQGPSIGVDNNVAAGTTLGGSAAAAVVEGTDVLTIRGVFNTPIYQINPAEDGDIRGAKTAGNGSITVRDHSPTGVPQEFQALLAHQNDPLPEALLLVSAGSDQVQAVVELTGVVNNGDGSVTVNFDLNDDYLKLSPNGAFPDALRTVAMLGILEEYRYYVRDADPAPRLSRARFYPGTDTAYDDAPANLVADIADNILDLQVALGIDRVAPAESIEDTQGGDDDWLFNSGDDDPDPNLWNGNDLPLYYLRITTLARTDRIDLKYVSPAIDAIEDRVYDEPEVPAEAERLARSYRRRLLQTVVDLRNLS